MANIKELLQKLKFVEDRLIKWMTDDDNDISAYFEIKCQECGVTKGEFYMQKQTSEIYCRDCLIYKSPD